jgi:hypothetical protein
MVLRAGFPHTTHADHPRGDLSESTLARECVLAIPSLVSFWDFQQPAGQQRLAHGPGAYALHEEGGTIERIEGGIFGSYAARFSPGHWLACPREACPLLNLHGQDAEVSILAWLRRGTPRQTDQAAASQAIAGIWHESEHRRQYGLFLDVDSTGAVVATGQVACIGGPSSSQRSQGEAGPAPAGIVDAHWHLVAYTYGRSPTGATQGRIYLDGTLIARADHASQPYPGGIFNSGAGGADFMVGAIHRSGEMGHWFCGDLAGLGVCNRAVSAHAISQIHQQVPALGGQ